MWTLFYQHLWHLDEQYDFNSFYLAKYSRKNVISIEGCGTEMRDQMHLNEEMAKKRSSMNLHFVGVESYNWCGTWCIFVKKKIQIQLKKKKNYQSNIAPCLCNHLLAYICLYCESVLLEVFCTSHDSRQFHFKVEGFYVVACISTLCTCNAERGII